MNKSDSERIAAVLEQTGLKPAKTEDTANFVILNMCSVRQRSVDKIFEKIRNLKRKNKKLKVVLTGCILKSDNVEFQKIADIIFKISDLPKLPQIIGKELDTPILEYLKITPKYQKNKFAYVPIMTGCNNFCAYCVVPYTRGREISRPEKDIILEIKKLFRAGYKSIWLLGQNVNSYKYKNLNFPKLLKKIEELPGNFEIAFLTSHPKDFSDELIETIAKSKKIKRYIHLPVQAGSTKILKVMNRKYTREHYLNLIKKIRKNIKSVEISTDIIVGFPGETKKDFEDTVDLVKKAKYSVAYIARYSPRAGTVAAKMKDNVKPEEKQRREKVLRQFFIKK
jgi:tRNA-2-methylthio-N6-dimethylallyladenosine synthase